MGRRTIAGLLVVASVTGAITACSTDDDPVARPASTSAVSPTASAPPPVQPSRPQISGTPGGSSRTLVSPTPGLAPATPFRVVERQLALSRGDRPLPTTVFAPAGGGPFPLVLFSHGLTSEPQAYAELLTAWAKAGFVVAAPAYPFTSHGAKTLNPLDVVNQPADASAVITQVLALNAKPRDTLHGRIDGTRIAAAGHSAGGITTIALFSGNRDARLTAGVVLSGQRALSTPFTGPPAPLLFVHGRLDNTVPYAKGLAAYRAVPWSRALMSVTDGGHVAITKDFAPVLATTTDFLRWGLYGDPAGKARLHEDATKGRAATLTDEL